MNIQTDHKEGGLSCVRITMTYDEARCLRNSPQKAWLWKRFWALMKCYI